MNLGHDLCFSFDDVAVVHARDPEDPARTVCGRRAIPNNLTRRKTTCTECPEHDNLTPTPEEVRARTRIIHAFGVTEIELAATDNGYTEAAHEAIRQTEDFTSHLHRLHRLKHNQNHCSPLNTPEHP